MKRSRELVGLIVISIEGGKELGKVRDIVIDTQVGEINALLIEDENWYLGAKVLPFEQIQDIGEYAVIVDREDAVSRLSDFPEAISLLDRNVKIIGTRVLIRSGKIIGTVREFFIDQEDGKILGCEVVRVDGDAENVLNIDVEDIITFGKDVLVVSQEAEKAYKKIIEVKEKKINIPPIAPIAPIDEEVEKVDVKPMASVQDEKKEEKKESQEIILDASPEDENQPAGLSKIFEQRQKRFILGKRTTKKIVADSGELIVDSGQEITEEIVRKAKNMGKFIELTMNVS